MLTAILIGLSLGCVYGLVGIGFSVVNRTTRVVNFMQGSFVMLSSMTTAWLLQSFQVPYLLAILAGLALCVIVGALVALVIVRPLWERRAAHFVFLIAMLVIISIVENVAMHWFGTTPKDMPSWSQAASVSIFTAQISPQYIWILASSVVLVVCFRFFLNHTMLGRAMRACAIDRETSSLLGISPQMIALLAFVLAGLLGGLAGVMIAPVRFTVFNGGLSYGLKGFVAGVVGGLSSIEGALVGGLLIGLLEAFAGLHLPTSYQDVIVFALLLVVIFIRPHGIIKGPGGGAWS
jgi:branched-chain amino acid transport system permease protein